jgi:hypothetical protein
LFDNEEGIPFWADFKDGMDKNIVASVMRKAAYLPPAFVYELVLVC